MSVSQLNQSAVADPGVVARPGVKSGLASWMPGKTSEFKASPRLIGTGVVVGVMALPYIPAAYLIPFAIFLGALTVFKMEQRQYRRALKPIDER